ncbi:MAG TPA: TetR/AcrR family transcriptional regulator [Candidatus Sabulitectum sp.]|nr:TetR/AcrR family transcriptional regulator [Candidatus Sabulitectum sp.]HPF31867.1 TetR/AcrR family transcriptional regulator [Candidatus Sabulitectum sp.]HPJ28320.1 TetR/AcrR family transcriptional regulator [Candidatus Sabulitectum sp.]HPR22440.1 TetR/AcrR family transcriptional regulator [Candidatus Sabulitectum sp.]
MGTAGVDEKTILNAAAKVFAEKGYDGARVDEIAAEAGMNKAMLYYRVGDKEELYRRVVLKGQKTFTDSVDRAISSASGPEEGIAGIVEAIAANAAESRLVPSIILREIAGGGSTLPPEGMAGIGRLMETVRNLVNDGAEKGFFRRVDPAALQFMVMGAVFTLSLTADMRKTISPDAPGPLTADEIASSICGILFQGIFPGGGE